MRIPEKHRDRGSASQLRRLLGRLKLVIAKLDRLSRDADFLLGLEKAGVDFVAPDMPQANRPTIGIMAVMAQHEREMNLGPYQGRAGGC